MVALSGPGWRLAPSLVAFVEEADERFTARDTTSDGSIGDTAHASRESDHNPYDGYVHAVDLDEDVAKGAAPLLPLWSHLIRVRDRRIRYLIYEGQIVKSYVDPAGHPAWVPYPYSGSNPHDKHLHISIDRTADARNDLRPWGFDVAYAPPQSAPPPIEEPSGMTFYCLKFTDPDRWCVIGPNGKLVSITAAQGYELAAGGARFISVQKQSTWDTIKAAWVA